MQLPRPWSRKRAEPHTRAAPIPVDKLYPGCFQGPSDRQIVGHRH